MTFCYPVAHVYIYGSGEILCVFVAEYTKEWASDILQWHFKIPPPPPVVLVLYWKMKKKLACLIFHELNIFTSPQHENEERKMKCILVYF